MALLDEDERLVYRKRLPNDAAAILETLEPYREEMRGLVVESTYNWYWLVDGLMDQGYRVQLANTAAIQQYAGLKYADDARTPAGWRSCCGWVCCRGYIYPKERRPVRDLLRKRSQLVRQRTMEMC